MSHKMKNFKALSQIDFFPKKKEVVEEVEQDEGIFHPYKPRPINSLAARVMFGESTHFKLNKKDGEVYENQPDIKQIKDMNLIEIDQHKKWAGVKAGRLTVIGKVPNSSGSNGGNPLFVCKCVCGYYCKKRKKGLVKIINQIPSLKNTRRDGCDWCEKTKRLRDGWI